MHFRRPRHTMARPSLRSVTLAVLFLLATSALPLSTGARAASRADAAGLSPSRTTNATTTTSVRIDRRSSPARSIVRDKNGWVATFTDGSRTVTLAGPPRVFAEASTPDQVSTSTWVRLLPAAFAGSVDLTWLERARTDRSPDVLAVAFQYVAGAPAIVDPSGRQIAGDASYGPLQADGTRVVGSDFSDYLGIPWTYPGGVIDAPEPSQLGALDCSGFVRMLLGYRSGFPLSLRPTPGALPRRAWELASSSPGPELIGNRGTVPTDRSMLAPGDLVFFDAETNDGSQIDHMGMYLGTDTAGHARFISSRKSADGPTMGDTNGRSVLDGTGLYARSFRSARRV